MAKKRPPGWQKKQEQKHSEKFGPRMTFEQVKTQVLEGEAARSGFQQLLERMERNPENFSDWGYFDADGNERENLDFLREGGKGDRP